MAVFSVTCPECKATLKSPKPIPAGKAITCPKCEVMFSAPAPKPTPKAAPKRVAANVDADDDIEVLDLEDVEIIEEGATAKPSVGGKPDRPRSPEGGKRRRSGRMVREKMSTTMLLLIIGAIVLGLAAFGVGGLLIWKYVINAQNEAVAYVPSEAPIVVGLDIKKIMSDTNFSPIVDYALRPTPINGYFQSANTTPKTMLDRIIVAIDLPDWSKRTVTLLSQVPIDQGKFVQAVGAKPVTVGGHSVYQSSHPLLDGKLLFPSSSNKAVALVNWAKNEEAMVGQMGKCKPSPAVAAMVGRAASNGHVWAVIDLESQQVQTLFSAIPGFSSAKDSRCIGLWIKFGTPEVQIVVQQQMKSGINVSASMQKAQADFERDKIQYAGQAALLPGNFGSLLQDYLNNMSFSTSSDCIVWKTKLKMASLEPVLMDYSRSILPSISGR
ncbi:MAG: hypothetical protein ACJ8C4_20145 [Gemmataceae bacterium]